MNDKYQVYSNDPYLFELMDYYNLESPEEEDRLWIIEIVSDAPLSVNFQEEISKKYENRPYYINASDGVTQWDHPFDRFFVDFLEIENNVINSSEMSNAELALSRRPPRMIRDILAMAAYFNISTSDWEYFWIPMLAICVNLKESKWTYSEDDEMWESDSCQYAWHPYDALLSQLKYKELAAYSPIVFPKLTYTESKLVPENCCLCWNFKEMRCYIVNSAEIENIEQMRPPSIERLDNFIGNNDWIEFCDLDNISKNRRIFPIELYNAWERTGARLFQGLSE